MILPWRSRTSKKVYSHEDQARANVVQALTSRGPKRVFLLLLLLLLFVLRIQRSWSSSGGFSVKDYIDMLDHSHIASAQSRDRADAGLTSLDSSHSKTRTLAKIAMCYGDPPLVYARALARQRLHNDMHGYDMFLLREKLLSRLWSKPAYILGVMLKEMEKPAEERLQWLFWFDIDMALMNPNIPLETFLPPAGLPSPVNILVANDHNGLNDGAFFVRVGAWAVQLFNDVLAMPTLKPHVHLKYSEQSALEHMLKQDAYRNETVYVPQRWFNAYIGRRDAHGEIVKRQPNTANKGDLIIHFAGKQATKDKMNLYMDIAERRDPLWELPLSETGLVTETAAFWEGANTTSSET